MAEGGEDEIYVLRDASKILAITQLDDLVRQGALKSEKAAYAKAKWEALKSTYLAVTGTERKLKVDVDEMEIQLKGIQSEMARVLKCCEEDEVTIELVKEDAEAAEAEATLMREKEQATLMEGTDLTRLQDLYQEKIQEIEREHATALAPLLNRLRLDIQDAKDSIAENHVKQEQCTKEVRLIVKLRIEEYKIKIEETLEEISNIHNKRKDHQITIETLEGQPDKYRKQADILITAVTALQLQDQKWLEKVKDVDLNISAHQASLKKLQEELATIAIQIEKNRQQTEQKERQAADFQRDLELATLEVDDYLADQVNVDMQLRSRMLDLKAEQEHLATRNKEKDKALRRLKYEEQLVANIQAHLPALIMDRDKIHHQVMLVEAEKEKVTTQVNEIRREIDFQMHNFLVVEGLGKEVATALRASHEKVSRLEKEVGDCANIERLKNQHTTSLIGIRERICRQAAAKQHMWKEAEKELHMKQVLLSNNEKKHAELLKQVDDGMAMYNLVRSQRNKYAALVQASAISIAEMKDKMMQINTEVESQQSDVKYKDKVLHKQRNEFLVSVRERTRLLSELSKATIQLRETQASAEEYVIELSRLEVFVTKTQREMARTRKLYALEVTTRNQTGLSLIDRNDELCILYEKYNVQMELLKHSDLELSRRNDEIRFLNIQCKHVQQSIFSSYKTTPDFPGMYRTLEDLREQLEAAKVAAFRLAELVENPENTSRWRLLPGRDLNELDLHAKMTAIEEFLSAKSDQALEKNLILEEITALAEECKNQAGNGKEGHMARLGKLNLYQRFMDSVTRRLMATVSELSLCQATAMSFKEERDKLRKQLDDAYARLEVGECPTGKAARDWEAKIRDVKLLRRMQAEREMARLREQQDPGKRAQALALQKTTAEQRPNAYIEEDLGLPKPFGLYAPFKPSDAGGQLRFYHKPETKVVES